MQNGFLGSNNVGKRPVPKPRKRKVNAVEVGSTEILRARNWRRECPVKQDWRGQSLASACCSVEEEEEGGGGEEEKNEKNHKKQKTREEEEENKKEEEDKEEERRIRRWRSRRRI
jgi:hypothetical protein